MQPGPLFLIVDDHPLMRQALHATIGAAFKAARIQEAGSGGEAVRNCRDLVPDLVLLDVNLQGENGLEIARRLLAEHCRLKVLIVAAEADPRVVREALDLGALGFVDKACSAEFLLEAVTAALEKRVFLCPQARHSLRRREGEQDNAALAEPAGLSRREGEVLKCLAQGENTKSTAFLLKISPKTVETHRQHIMRKLGLESIAALTRYAIRQGIINP